MEESKYNLRIEKIANQLIHDNVSIDEQDEKKLHKYRDFVKSEYNLNDDDSMKIVYEALLYLKLKSSDSTDPLQHGDKFGAGFS
ncbi:MAG: hypothetical protein R3327_05315 [Nitrosopumilaceae archaeon]|nr:hypothetical protein [Nitrosopumilaceae archaeon]